MVKNFHHCTELTDTETDHSSCGSHQNLEDISICSLCLAFFFFLACHILPPILHYLWPLFKQTSLIEAGLLTVQHLTRSITLWVSTFCPFLQPLETLTFVYNQCKVLNDRILGLVRRKIFYSNFVCSGKNKALSAERTVWW